MADRPVSARQRRILQVIRDTVRERGYPPSMREIAEAVGLASTSTVSYQLAQLQKLGYLRRVPHKQRAVEVVTPGSERNEGPVIRDYRRSREPLAITELQVQQVRILARLVLAGPAIGDPEGTWRGRVEDLARKALELTEPLEQARGEV